MSPDSISVIDAVDLHLRRRCETSRAEEPWATGCFWDVCLEISVKAQQLQWCSEHIIPCDTLTASHPEALPLPPALHSHTWTQIDCSFPPRESVLSTHIATVCCWIFTELIFRRASLIFTRVEKLLHYSIGKWLESGLLILTLHIKHGWIWRWLTSSSQCLLRYLMCLGSCFDSQCN